MREDENHQGTTSRVIVVTGELYQWMLKFEGKNVMGGRWKIQSQSIIPQNTLLIKKRKTLIYNGEMWEDPSYVSDQS